MVILYTALNTIAAYLLIRIAGSILKIDMTNRRRWTIALLQAVLFRLQFAFIDSLSIRLAMQVVFYVFLFRYVGKLRLGQAAAHTMVILLVTTVMEMLSFGLLSMAIPDYAVYQTLDSFYLFMLILYVGVIGLTYSLVRRLGPKKKPSKHTMNVTTL